MNLARDFEDMLSALNSEKVQYLLVGGHAVMVHTEPRWTKDLDIWVRPSRQNAERLVRALKKFGAPTFKTTLDDLTRPDLILIVGVSPVRVDFLTSIPGLEFEPSFARSKKIRFGRASVRVLSPEDLLRNKLRVGRPQDLVDAEKLRPVVAARRAKARRRTSKR